MEMEQEVETALFETFENKCLENGKKMYLNERTADVHFLFGGNDKTAARIPAHKAILATDSDVFEAMFYGGVKEPNDVHIQDSTEVAFAEFLQYFYLDEVKLTVENMVDVLYLGAKYNVKKCVNDCVRSIVRSLDDQNDCDQLSLAILYEQKDWIELCEKRIMINTDAVFDSVEFLKCDKIALAHILKMDVLLCTEIEVFKACMSWVKAKGDWADLSIELVERHLGDSFYDIRLASLTLDELCTLRTQYESVLSRDFIHITNIITLPEFQAAKFNKNPRHTKWDAKAIVKCEREDDTDERDRRRQEHERHLEIRRGRHSCDWCDDDYYECCSYDSDFDSDVEDKYLRLLDTTEGTTFSLNKPLLLGSLLCIGILTLENCEYNCNRDLSTEMEIIETRDLAEVNFNVLFKMKIKLNSPFETDISLPYPAIIRPGFFYTIRLGPFPKSSDYYCKNRKKSVELESDIKIEFHGNYKYSLIKVLNFNKI